MKNILNTKIDYRKYGDIFKDFLHGKIDKKELIDRMEKLKFQTSLKDGTSYHRTSGI